METSKNRHQFSFREELGHFKLLQFVFSQKICFQVKIATENQRPPFLKVVFLLKLNFKKVRMFIAR